MISIIIPAWNGAAVIGACLESLEPQLQARDEIIVVDNGSADGTSELVTRDFPRVQVLRLEYNKGFAGGVNHGLQRANGDTLILMNQDIVLLPECLPVLQARLQVDGSAIVGCKLLYPDGQTIQHAGGVIRMPRGEPDHYGYRQIDQEQWNMPARMDYVTGALFVFDRAVFNAVGLFDEGFYPAYYEEVDYCYRAREAGFPVIYEPAAAAIHHESQTQNKRSDAYHETMEYHRVRFMLKHFSPQQLLQGFFPAEGDYVRRLPPAQARSIFARAYLRALLNLPAVSWLRADESARLAVIDALTELYRSACQIT